MKIEHDCPIIHPVGRVSFVESRVSSVNTFPPHQLACGELVWGCGIVIYTFSTKLTHTTWCRNRIESHATQYNQDYFCVIVLLLFVAPVDENMDTY